MQSAMLAGAGLALAGCGFRPLYGTASGNAGGVSVDNQMAGIRIDPIEDRLGQQLHNALRDSFNPLGQPASATYYLEVDLSSRTYGALTRRDLSASRRNVELSAIYTLKDTSGNSLMRDRSEITSGYDEFDDDPYNNVSALEDAERRGTLQLADQIRTRIAVFLTAGTTQSAPGAPLTQPPLISPTDTTKTIPTYTPSP